MVQFLNCSPCHQTGPLHTGFDSQSELSRMFYPWPNCLAALLYSFGTRSLKEYLINHQSTQPTLISFIDTYAFRYKYVYTKLHIQNVYTTSFKPVIISNMGSWVLRWYCSRLPTIGLLHTRFGSDFRVRLVGSMFHL